MASRYTQLTHTLIPAFLVDRHQMGWLKEADARTRTGDPFITRIGGSKVGHGQA
jgi:hypothetical protein